MRLESDLAKKAPRHDGSVRHGCGLLVGGDVRHGSHHPAFGYAHVLGIGAHTGTTEAEHPIADLEPRDLASNCGHLAGELAAEHVRAGPAETELGSTDQPEQQRHVELPWGHRFEVAYERVPEMYRRGMDPDEHLSILRDRSRDLRDVKDFRGTVLVEHRSSHRAIAFQTYLTFVLLLPPTGARSLVAASPRVGRDTVGSQAVGRPNLG